jgi:hypothetical protein
MCLIPTGITRTCGYSFGGVDKIYLGNKDYISAKMNASQQVTGFTVTNSSKFYRFEFEPESGQFLQELQAGNASKFIQQTLNFTLANITPAKKEILESVGLAKVSAIVQMQDGTYYLAGQFGSGLKATTLSIDSGTSIGDLNGSTVSLVGGSTGFANEVLSSALTSILA